MKSSLTLVAAAFFALVASGESLLAVTIPVFDGSGLSAEVEFTLPDATTLQVRAKNTSTGAPAGFDSADQILTSVSWDFGGATSIVGGSVATGPSSASVNFSVAEVGANADVSGEYGFGNGGTTGLHANFVSGNTAGATPFGGANLDGPIELNGPQGGLIANPAVVSLGGLGAIQDAWIATLTLSSPIENLDFLDNGVIVEFGSDAAFLPGVPGGGVVPEPSAAVLAAIGFAAVFARMRVRVRRR